MNYEENKKLCFHRVHHIVNDMDCDGDYDVYPCEYMINYCVSKYGAYFSDELEPDEEYCLKCPYRNKDMGDTFEINPNVIENKI